MPGLLAVNRINKQVPQFQRKTAFKVYSTTNLTPQVAGTTVNFTNKTYDLGNNFNLATDTYVVPYHGLYQYACYFVLAFTDAGASSTISLEMRSQFGVAFILFADTYKNHVGGDQHSVLASGSHIFEKDDALFLRAYGANNHIYVGTEESYYFTMYRIESESRTVL